jgi:hypothetical protein
VAGFEGRTVGPRTARVFGRPGVPRQVHDVELAFALRPGRVGLVQEEEGSGGRWFRRTRLQEDDGSGWRGFRRTRVQDKEGSGGRHYCKATLVGKNLTPRVSLKVDDVELAFALRPGRVGLVQEDAGSGGRWFRMNRVQEDEGSGRRGFASVCISGLGLRV